MKQPHFEARSCHRNCGKSIQSRKHLTRLNKIVVFNKHFRHRARDLDAHAYFIDRLGDASGSDVHGHVASGNLMREVSILGGLPRDVARVVGDG
jgi:hypothetical protein